MLSQLHWLALERAELILEVSKKYPPILAKFEVWKRILGV